MDTAWLEKKALEREKVELTGQIERYRDGVVWARGDEPVALVLEDLRNPHGVSPSLDPLLVVAAPSRRLSFAP